MPEQYLEQCTKQAKMRVDVKHANQPIKQNPEIQQKLFQEDDWSRRFRTWTAETYQTDNSPAFQKNLTQTSQILQTWKIELENTDRLFSFYVIDTYGLFSFYVRAITL